MIIKHKNKNYENENEDEFKIINVPGWKKKKNRMIDDAYKKIFKK